jgi:hypothetical protein
MRGDDEETIIRTNPIDDVSEVDALREFWMEQLIEDDPIVAIEADNGWTWIVRAEDIEAVGITVIDVAVRNGSKTALFDQDAD